MQEILECAVGAARAAGKMLLNKFETVHPVEKTKNNLVTEADLECEEAIVEAVRKDFPGHSILAEERRTGADVLSDHLWIIDPLDGTNNYAHTIPHFCVSIAYAEAGKPLVGVVYDPVRNEFFSSVKGKGAFLNGKRIEASRTKNVTESIITTGFYYDRGKLMERTLASIHSLFNADIRGIRRLGSAALDLCWVACGRFDGYFEYQLSPWDFAAGMLLVKEAGGTCIDREGRELGLTSKSVVASNGKIHDEFFRIVGWRE